MSHIHIPDGVLAKEWIIGGYSFTVILLVAALTRLRKRDPFESIGRIGIISAFMLLAMSLPVGFLPVHMNLAVLSGIILGPWAGVVSAFVVNLLLAFVGHGGITVLGLNTATVSIELLIGFLIFRGLSRFLRPSGAALLATALALTASLVITVWLMGTLSPDLAASGGEDMLYHDDGHSAVTTLAGMKTALATVLPISAVGILVESVVIAGVVAYLAKVRPGLLGSR